jgi:molybdate transport system permease protein
MPPILTPLALTLKVASLATLLAFLLGVALAFLLARKNFPLKEWLDAFFALPLVLPPTVLGYYLIVVVGRNGILGRMLHEHLGVSLMFTWQGAVLASALVSLPLIVKSARCAFEEVDVTYENAARDLGASEPLVFLKISFPLAWPGIFAGTMLAFARGMGEFGATLMVAGNLPGKTQTLSMAIYEAVQAGDDPRACILSLAASLVCMAVLVGSRRALGPER